MSRESIVAVQEAYGALATRGLDRFLDHWTDDLDHRSIEGAPDDRGPIRGKDAMRAYVQDWMDTFDGFSIEPVELIDADGETIVAVLRYGGRAKLSGIKTDETFGVVFTIRDRKIARGRCGSRRIASGTTQGAWPTRRWTSHSRFRLSPMLPSSPGGTQDEPDAS
jgi:ketosteroid isomerase-like protein